MKKVVDIAHKAGAVIGVQINHAGAKAETDEVKYAPGIKNFMYLEQSKTKLVGQEDLKRIEQQFVNAAHRAKAAGFDFVEIHGAHGYFLNEVMSKALNEVNDSKDILIRAQIVINIVQRVKNEVKIPVGIRFSFDDYASEGMVTEDYFPLIKVIDEYISYINASSGASVAKENISDLIAEHGKLYRLPIAKKVREITKKNIIGVGNVSSKEDALQFLENNIDAVGIGRELLFNPNLAIMSFLDVEELASEDYH